MFYEAVSQTAELLTEINAVNLIKILKLLLVASHPICCCIVKTNS